VGLERMLTIDVEWWGGSYEKVVRWFSDSVVIDREVLRWSPYRDGAAGGVLEADERAFVAKGLEAMRRSARWHPT
jgi:hypothetical protein